MTATVKRFPKSNPNFNPKTDDIANRLRDIAHELGVIYWAAAGLQETLGDGDHLVGIEHGAGRLQAELKALAEELRS
jgi:hypothetical protein